MDAQQVIKELEGSYPGKNIVTLGEPDVTEIICETHPTGEHAGWSTAISVIDRIAPHYHKETTEVYEVIRGSLLVCKDGTEFRLKEGESLEILPGEVHSAIGEETWIKAHSTPGWVTEDHYLVEG